MYVSTVWMKGIKITYVRGGLSRESGDGRMVEGVRLTPQSEHDKNLLMVISAMCRIPIERVTGKDGATISYHLDLAFGGYGGELGVIDRIEE